MLVNKKPYLTIWADESNKIRIIDQTLLPYEFKILELATLDDAIEAIVNMRVRGAPLIGITAVYGLFLSLKNSCDNQEITKAASKLIKARPTAINLKWAVDKAVSFITSIDKKDRSDSLLGLAKTMAKEDIKNNEMIGSYGYKIIKKIYDKKKSTINILTHCNAGWLAAVDWGTATAPIYKARDMKVPIHVWVDETRPRNQGSFLTSWELQHENIDHTIIVDNTGGHLMQRGLVDIVITGSDRTTYTGDVCNKIGTYLKALAAFDNNIPFYVALPTSTIDWEISDGSKIDIELRNENEVHYMNGIDNDIVRSIRVSPENTKAVNFAFDVTPSKYVSGLITEHGVIEATESEILKLNI